jgi:hypothetical protein
VRVLVLDPALPEPARAFLKEREAHAGGAYACREVPLEGLAAPPERTAVLDRLREMAEREANALVVAADGKDAMFFAGAKLPFTLVKHHPRGIVLESAPDLVPLPTPLPPPLFDEKGEPLMPHAELEQVARKETAAKHSWDYGLQPDDVRHDWTAPDCLFRSHGRDHLFPGAEDLNALSRAIWRASSADQPASFPVHLVLRWHLRGQGVRLLMVRDLADGYGEAFWVVRSGIDGKLADHVCRILVGSGRATILWSHQRQILGVGSRVDPIAELLAPHHAIAQPAALLRWKEALDTWNPWRSGGKDGLAESGRWTSLRDDALRELGFPIDGTVAWWREHVAQRCARPLASARLASPEEAQSAQEALAMLAERCWKIEGWNLAWPLRLDAASRARLATLPGHGEHEAIHVVANMGAGRLLRIGVVRFPGEEPTEIVKYGRALEMDGGDVHLWFEELADTLLEGSARPAPERGRRETDD